MALGVFLFASLAFGAATFADAPGDENAAPDVTSVAVSEAPDGMLTLVVSVGNYRSLPADSWFNLRFDLDSNAQTGDLGDEALVATPPTEVSISTSGTARSSPNGRPRGSPAAMTPACSR